MIFYKSKYSHRMLDSEAPSAIMDIQFVLASRPKAGVIIECLVESVWYRKQKQDRQEIIHPSAEHSSDLADLSAASDLHNPNKISKAFAFIATSTLFFSVFLNVPFAVPAQQQCWFLWWCLC